MSTNGIVWREIVSPNYTHMHYRNFNDIMSTNPMIQVLIFLIIIMLISAFVVGMVFVSELFMDQFNYNRNRTKPTVLTV